MRNLVEGWQPNPPAMHNRVHVWVGGDMSPASSPNDPVFFLNHCNVDRLWADWQQNHGNASYLPGGKHLRR
jgi:tyrosinase